MTRKPKPWTAAGAAVPAAEIKGAVEKARALSEPFDVTRVTQDQIPGPLLQAVLQARDDRLAVARAARRLENLRLVLKERGKPAEKKVEYAKVILGMVAADLNRVTEA